MNRDTLKTLLGLLFIGILIVATFLYGNAQHQKQVRQDQTTKQTATASSTPKTTVKPSSAPKPSPSVVAVAPTPTLVATTTPQTGATDVMVPLAALIAGVMVYRSSRRRLKLAIVSR